MISACARCRFRQHSKLGNACLADAQRRSIYIVARLPLDQLPEKCPIPEAPAESPRLLDWLRPGNVVESVLMQLGYTKTAGCGCAKFKARMNEWGWWGCRKHRGEIVEWFSAKAREAGITVERDHVWSLVKAGFRDMRKRKIRA